MKRRKLLLISANKFDIPYPVYPIGISYLQTYLNDNLTDFDVEIYDMISHNISELKIEILNIKPDYIGISLRNIDDVNSLSKNMFVENVKNIIECVRTNSNAKIILGGSGFSIFPIELFEYLKPDYGITGEGEKSLCNLLKSIENGSPDLLTAGLVYESNGKNILNKNYDYLRGPKLNFDDDLLEYYWQKSGMINIQTKRGCPFECIYCTYPIIEGHRVRHLDCGNIIETISRLYKDKGIDYFFFTDSVFNLGTERCINLAEKIIESGVKIKWGAYFSPYRIIKEEMKLYRESGLTHVEFGSDSFSDKMLENYHKPFNVDTVIKSAEITDELGIYQAHFLIFGGPGETNDTINETFENSKKMGKAVFFPFIGMRIYPSTTLESISQNEGVLNNKIDLTEPVFYNSCSWDTELLRGKAELTGKRWVFPDEDHSGIIEKMRAKNKKGPLWEYLII